MQCRLFLRALVMLFAISAICASSTASAQGTPGWAADTVWYQIFPERFRNGDASNDEAGAYPARWNRAFPELEKIHQYLTPWNADWFQFTAPERAAEQVVLGTFPGTPRYIVEGQVLRNRRYGGDIRGIRTAVPYLKQLGITGVYLNPIFMSPSEHKYDTYDYRHVDEHFGPMTADQSGKKVLLPADREILSHEDFRNSATWGYTTADMEFAQLVNELHAAGIRVVLDGVFNHESASGTLAKDLARNGKASPYFGWFAAAYEGDASYPSLPCSLGTLFPDSAQYPHAAKIHYKSWDAECSLIVHRQGFPGTVLHPEMQRYLFDVTDRWMRPKNINGMNYGGIDGIRLDVYGDIPAPFWQSFRGKVKSVKADALIVAEDWGDGAGVLRGDQVDSIMNYQMRTLVEAWFINVNSARFRPSQAKGFVDTLMSRYRDETKYVLWSMLSSHDTDRVLSRTLMHNRTLTANPEIGNSWNLVNHPDLTDPRRSAPYSNDRPGVQERAFFKSIVAFQMAYIGAPMIYYGDEAGMWGASDPTDRKPMAWPDTSRGQAETQCVKADDGFCSPTSLRYSAATDTDMTSYYSRMIQARHLVPALTHGAMNTNLQFRINNALVNLGGPECDAAYIFGFERGIGNSLAYFVSNENLGVPSQTFAVRTRYAPGSTVRELISNKALRVGDGGEVELSLDRDRAALLINQ